MTDPLLEQWLTFLRQEIRDAIRENIHPSVLRDEPDADEPDETDAPAND